MKLFLDLVDGKKNYLFAAGLIAIGLIEWAFPVVQIQILTMSTPQDFIAAGIAWGLGRNALAKVGVVGKNPSGND